MSIKITVSYTDDIELQKVVALLSPIIHRLEKRNNQQGKYKKADIVVKR